MKCGLQFSVFAPAEGPTAIRTRLARAVQLADEVGFDSLWVMDHFWQVGAPNAELEPMLEGWTTLGYMAAHCERASLGLMIGGVHFRAPGLWVKAATTLDVLTGGRAWLGIGAGWNDEESLGLGFGFPPRRERFAMLEETLQFANEMWEGERGSERAFDGQHYHATRALNVPQSLSRPRVPVMIGGSGERRTLLLVARYADACNIGMGVAADVHHKFRVLAEHCSHIGRPFESIERTTRQSVDVDDDRERLLSWFTQLAAAGAQHVIISVDFAQLESIERFARDLIPQIHALEPADPRLPPAMSLGAPTGIGLDEWLRSWRRSPMPD